MNDISKPTEPRARKKALSSLSDTIQHLGLLFVWCDLSSDPEKAY